MGYSVVSQAQLPASGTEVSLDYRRLLLTPTVEQLMHQGSDTPEGFCAFLLRW